MKGSILPKTKLSSAMLGGICITCRMPLLTVRSSSLKTLRPLKARRLTRRVSRLPKTELRPYNTKNVWWPHPESNGQYLMGAGDYFLVEGRGIHPQSE